MEENKLIQLAQAGDEGAKEEMYNRYVKSINDVTWRFKNHPRFIYDDFFQVACVGFTKALNRFNIDLGYEFTTYLYPKMVGEIRRHLRDYKGLIKHSRSSVELFSKIYRMKLKEYSIEKISEELNISCKKVREIEKEFARDNISSFDIKVDLDNEETILDCFVGEEEADVLEILYIKECINKLTNRQKEVVIRFFFKDETQQEISKMLGISQAQVSRDITKSLKILKKHMEVKDA